MKNKNKQLLPLITFLLSANVFAVGVPVGHQFQGGQPASASQVNENFQELADRIADIPEANTYDYRLYLSSVASKVFNVSDGSSCDVETLTYNRTPSGNNTSISIGRITTDNGTPCFRDVRYFNATPSAYENTGTDSYDPVNGLVTGRYRFEPVRIIALTPMAQGHQYSFHSQSFYTPDGSSEQTQSIQLRDLTAVAIENITVAAGSFNNCLKISQKVYIGADSIQRLSWRCPVVGEVKYIHISATGSYTLKELASYTP